MSFWEKMKFGAARLMYGRYGSDHLGMFTLIAALALSLLDGFIGGGIFSLLGMILYILTLYRMFSRQIEKRRAENQKYLAIIGNWKTKWKQFKNRVKNRDVYKYFKCPQCKALLRLTRGCGPTKVNCPRCHHEFDQKA